MIVSLVFLPSTLVLISGLIMIVCMCFRIPVYDKDPALNIVGLLYVKDLVLLNPDDEFKIKDILHFYNHVPVTLQVSNVHLCLQWISLIVAAIALELQFVG